MFAKGERAIGDDLVKGRIDKTNFEFSEIGRTGYSEWAAEEAKLFF